MCSKFKYRSERCGARVSAAFLAVVGQVVCVVAVCERVHATSVPRNDALSDLEKRGCRVTRDTDGSPLSVDCTFVSMRRGDARAISKCPSLRRITLCGCMVGDEFVLELSGLTKLVAMDLQGTQVSDRASDGLRKLKRLRILNLALTNVGDEAVTRLATLRRLERLSLMKTQITDRSMNALSKCRKLIDLDISQTAVSDAGVSVLRNLPLKTLVASGCAQLRGTAFRQFARSNAARSLRRMYLSSTGVSDAGLAEIAALRQLKYLALSETSVGTRGVGQLRALRKLHTLHLANTSIDDNCVIVFEGIPRLARLTIAGSDITPHGEALCAEALPRCTIK